VQACNARALTCKFQDISQSIKSVATADYCNSIFNLTTTCSYFFFLQEDANRGKPNWEHLADDLHVLITVEDTENRAKLKLQRAVEEVQKLLVPVSHAKSLIDAKSLIKFIHMCHPKTASRRRR
jgi:hypothetical protein